MEDQIGFHLTGKQFNPPRKSASLGSAGRQSACFPNGIASWPTRTLVGLGATWGIGAEAGTDAAVWSV
jgi:hypothetical protein